MMGIFRIERKQEWPDRGIHKIWDHDLTLSAV